MKLKILTHWVGLGALTALALGVVFTTGLTERADAQAAELDVLHVRGPIYMIAGAGGNTTASVGLDGTLLVDTGLAGRSDDILEVIQSLANLLSIQPGERASYGRFGADFAFFTGTDHGDQRAAQADSLGSEHTPAWRPHRRQRGIGAGRSDDLRRQYSRQCP